MIVYLAGDVYTEQVFPMYGYKFNRLDSFFYMNKKSEQHIKKYDSYLLDSGAFTFIMSKKGVSIDIDSYTDKYIDFINDNGIDLFFEMDVDAIYGYEKVKALRRRIEAKTGKPVIPVFHKARGLDDWISLCKEYSYVSIGIAGKDVPWGDYKTFLKFANSAISLGSKLHGLGITGMKSLTTVPFHSVDSSAWTAGNRYKQVFSFDGRTVKAVKVDLSKKKISNPLLLASHNLGEWIKFSNSVKHKRTI